MNHFFKENAKKKITGCVLLAAGFALFLASRISHSFAQWYSVKIYPLWVGSIGRAAGLLPCSLSELLLYALLLWLAITGSVQIYGALCRRRTAREGIRDSGSAAGRGRKMRSWFSMIFLLACTLFFLYEMNCGVNYHRNSFSESAEMKVREYTKEELKEVCLWLTQEVNSASGKVDRDSEGIMRISADAGSGAALAMQKLGTVYRELEGYYPCPKGLLVPWILGVQNLSGIYSPFTVEANYNSGMTDYNIPFTMCHELSHLRGFMQEQEANFIAFLACRASEDGEFRYSGNLMGWIYCMNVLRQADYDAWEEVRMELSPDVEKDLRANSDYWAQYDGRIAEVSNRINDTYLKANGQSEGVKSYDRMVDLIVNWKLGTGEN